MGLPVVYFAQRSRACVEAGRSKEVRFTGSWAGVGGKRWWVSSVAAASHGVEASGMVPTALAYWICWGIEVVRVGTSSSASASRVSR